MRTNYQGKRRPRAGFTLVEMMISLTIVSIILLATAASLQREAESISQLQKLSYSERMIQDLFTKIEQRVDFGQGINPTTTLAAGLSSGETTGLVVQEPLGFPYEGTIVIEPGTASEERVTYTSLAPNVSELAQLTRGVRGTGPTGHAANSLVLWEGISFPIEDQVAPAAGTFDGQTDDLRGQIFYRGDGVGFAYRRPVDPAGTGTFIDAGDIRWGATVGGADTSDGCACLVFSPIGVVTEAERNFDINNDGDLLDTFDLGGITDLAWNSVDPDLGTSSLELVSPILLQEQDNYGADLNGDGFNDPMFLWTPASGRLRIRMFALLGDVNDREIVKRFETVLYLRNGAAAN
jgi:prepilin-type N-terminal cleavage/methylation domain-containing protein